MLKFRETNWKSSTGFNTRTYTLNISSVRASKTIIEQQAKITKLSLVAFLNKEQKGTFVNICRRLKRNNKDFYQNKNLHVTLFGFGPLAKKYHESIREVIQQYIIENRIKKINIKFDSVRPGTMYSRGKTPRPQQKISNGTVIAYGTVNQNKNFFNYTNKLGQFLLNDEKIKSILGANFRRKFPSVWCTLGYYRKNTSFKINDDLQRIFIQHSDLTNRNLGNFSLSGVSLVVSNYKNLRYHKLIQKYQL